jgi:hypothetical protein
VLEAVALQPALAFPQPAFPSLNPRDDPRWIELERHPLGDLLIGILGRLVGLVPAAQLFPSLAEELTPTLGRAQPLGQLVATLLAAELILGLIGGLGLSQDLARDPLKPTVRIRTAVAVQPKNAAPPRADAVRGARAAALNNKPHDLQLRDRAPRKPPETAAR